MYRGTSIQVKVIMPFLVGLVVVTNRWCIPGRTNRCAFLVEPIEGVFLVEPIEGARVFPVEPIDGAFLVEPIEGPSLQLICLLLSRLPCLSVVGLSPVLWFPSSFL